MNRAAVLHAAKDLRVEDVPTPEPGPLEVLVEIATVGVCGSDVHYYEHGRIGPYVVEAPMVLGHESAGRVVALGQGATQHAVGDRVALEPGVPCGRCRECRGGRYNLCRFVAFFATPPIDGAFANFVAIHEDFAFTLPDAVSDEAGALIEPLSVGIWACEKAKVGPGDRLLITGAGPIGLLAAQVAAAAGATEIVVADVNDARLAVAPESGATRTIDVGRESLVDAGIEADVLFECSGHPASLDAGIRSLRPAGTAVVVGMGPEEESSIPLAYIQSNEIWLTGTFRYANTYPTAISLITSGKVDPTRIITGRFDLDHAEDALLAGRRDPASVKAMVTPG